MHRPWNNSHCLIKIMRFISKQLAVHHYSFILCIQPRKCLLIVFSPIIKRELKEFVMFWNEHTVGGIKTVTFPFRTVPFKRNTSVPFAVQFPFRGRKRSINMLGVSYQRVRNQS